MEFYSKNFSEDLGTGVSKSEMCAVETLVFLMGFIVFLGEIFISAENLVKLRKEFV